MPKLRAAALFAALALLSALVPLAGYPPAQAAAGGSGFTGTKTVTRDQLLPDGTTTTVDSRSITLSVSNTQNLRGLQQIDVSWAGAHPTGGLISDPNDGTTAIRSEYPMVLLECRGTDSATAPPSSQLSPGTCWTAYMYQERSQVFIPPSGATGATGPSSFPGWRLDMYAPATQRTPVAGAPDPSTPVGSTTAGALLSCLGPYTALFWQPFQAADGTTYYPSSCAPVPPEAAGNGGGALAFPSNETYASTGSNGTGKAKFDVFTQHENASLGCSDTVPCALVAVPIMGLSCDLADLGVLPSERPSPTETVSPLSGTTGITALADADQNCAAVGSLAPGVGAANLAEYAVTGALWWAASNWRNRITVPLSFAPVQDPCAAAPPGRSEVDIYGSELMAPAMAQWDPHFCADPSLFTLKHVQTAEGTARRTVAQRNSEAAFATYNPTGAYTSPVVSAPVALTGFAIAFSIDDDNGNEVASLNLNARLLAKLLTQSYPDDARGIVGGEDTGCPNNVTGTILPPDQAKLTPPCALGALSHNPLNVYVDPEFRALNPGIARAGTKTALDRVGQFDSAATLYALSTDSDVMYAVSSYIANDPEARAWLGGAPDPWGMVVNPAYNLSAARIQVPTESWPLLDQYYSPWGLAPGDSGPNCPPESQTPFMDLVASPVQSLVLISQAIEFAHPLSNMNCAHVDSRQDPRGFTLQMQRDPVMRIGERFVLGVVSLAQAKEFDLHTASLQTQSPAEAPGQFAPPTKRSFVAPTNASLAAAALLLAPDRASGTWQIPSAAIPSGPAGQGAYPGTMLVNAEVPVSGLPPTDAANIAKFLQFAAGPGQTPGTSFGQLPDGYLPMTAGNGMADLVAYTQAAAAAVAAQNGVVPPLPGQSGAGSTGSGGAGGSGGGGTTPSATATRSPSSSSSPGVASSGTTSSGRGPGSFSALAASIHARSALPSVPNPVQATQPTGVAAAVGKTLRLASAVAGSLLRWLTYLAVLALLLAAALYFAYGRRRWELFGPGLTANLRELLMGVFARRRGP